MITCALFRDGDALRPYSREDLQILRGIEGVPEDTRIVNPELLIRAQLTAPRRPRSYQQLKLWWACCRQVAENTDDENWRTATMVAEQVKLQLRYLKSWMVTPDGTVHIVTGSLSYKELGHLEACQFFTRAWPVLAEKIGVTVEELLAETESEMRWRMEENDA